MQRPGGERSRTYLQVQKELAETGEFSQKELMKDVAGGAEGELLIISGILRMVLPIVIMIMTE